MRANLIVAFFIISLILLTPAAARTYRWVDENGHTVYSQSRPPSGDATVIKPPPPPPPASEQGDTMKKLKARLDALNKDNEKKNMAKEEKDKAAKKADIKKRNCQTATEHLTTLEQHAQLKMKMDDGNYKMLTEEERAADIEKAKKAIEKYCE